MDANVLIDAVVRQTTILLAQLATATGGRATLAHTANQIFVDLVHELKAQGLGNKVIADMFGVALRTYHEKVRRLSESTRGPHPGPPKPVWLMRRALWVGNESRRTTIGSERDAAP